MDAFLSVLTSGWDFIFQVLTLVYQLYSREPVFMAVLSLWVLNRVFGIFDLLKG